MDWWACAICLVQKFKIRFEMRLQDYFHWNYPALLSSEHLQAVSSCAWLHKVMVIWHGFNSTPFTPKTPNNDTLQKNCQLLSQIWSGMIYWGGSWGGGGGVNRYHIVILWYPGFLGWGWILLKEKQLASSRTTFHTMLCSDQFQLTDPEQLFQMVDVTQAARRCPAGKQCFHDDTPWQ